MNKKNGQKKLLAAVAVFAMVACVLAIAPAYDSEGTVSTIQSLGNDDISDDNGTKGWSYVADSSSGVDTLTLTGPVTVGFNHSNSNTLTIKVSGNVNMNLVRDNNANDFVAIQSGGKIIIQDDGVTGADKLTLSVTGKYTGTAGSEHTYGIKASNGLDVNNIEIDMDISTNDAYAFAISANGNVKFNTVTGSIDGGNRAIHVGTHTLTFLDSTMTLTGFEKAVQAKVGSVTLGSASGNDSNIIMLINETYGGVNGTTSGSGGLNDAYALKVKSLTVNKGSELSVEGLHIFGSEAGSSRINGELEISKVVRGAGVNTTYVADFVIDTNQVTTIESSGKVTLPEGTSTDIDATLSNAGTIVTYSDMNNVTNTTGTVAVAPGVKVCKDGGINAVEGTVTTTAAYEDALGLNNNLDSDYTIKTKAFLEKNLIIAKGVTLTVDGNATLDLNGKDLIVLGTLVVNNNGKIVGGATEGFIKIGKTGVIENKGVLGADGAPLKVTMSSESMNSNEALASGVGTVTLDNATGIEFSVNKKTGNSSVEYNLVISGNVSKKGTANATVDISGTVMMKGAMSIGNGVTLDVQSGAILAIQNGSTFEVTSKGVLTNTDNGMITLGDDVIVELNGSSKAIFSAETGGYITNGTYSTKTYTVTITIANVYGIVLETESVTAYDENVNNTVTTKYLYMSGTAKEFETGSTPSTIGITATGPVDESLIAAGLDYKGFFVKDALSVEKETVFTFSGSTEVTVLGTVTYKDDTDDFYTRATNALIGAKYSIKAIDENGIEVETFYIKSFDAALEIIDTVVDKTLYVHGPVEICTEVTLEAGQTLNGGAYTVTEDGTLTIGADAALITDDPVISTYYIVVNGTLVVTTDGSCISESNIKFSAKSVNDAGDITYSGFLVALKNAKSGDVIEVSEPTTVGSDIIINEGVTLKVVSGGSLSAESGKTIDMTVNGTLINEGTININGSTVVTGKVDSSSTAITLCGSSNESVIVNGEIIATANQSDTGINAVKYINEDGEKVYTTLAKATIAAAAKDVKPLLTQIGTLTDSTETVLKDTTLEITGTAKFGDITLDGGKVNVTGSGKLSATVSAKTGADGTETSAIVFDEVQTISVESGYTTNSQNVKVWALTIKEDATFILAGKLTVSAGTAILGTSMSVAGNSALFVSEGATLVVPYNATAITLTANNEATDKGAVVIDGTIVVNGTVTVSGFMTVNGTMTVTKNENKEGAALIDVDSNLIVTGNLDIVGTDGYKGASDISGTLTVGAKPSTLGAVAVIAGDINTTATGTVKVYAGSDISGAAIDVESGESQAKSTAFYINGGLYMTVYTQGTVTVNDEYLIGEEFDILGYDLDDSTNSITDLDNWYTDAELKTEAGSDGIAIGSKDGLYFKATVSTVRVIVSVGSQISLYVDGLKINGTQEFTVGTHQVSATVNPGFHGDVTITFMGQVVTDSFTITPEMDALAFDKDTIILSVTGEISQDSQVVVDGGSEGLGLTDILLIVLVVLIVVMAIIVAMRMMRS